LTDQTATETSQTETKPPKTFNKFKLGRPSKYQPKYCQKIIEYFTQELFFDRVKSVITQKSGSEIINYEMVPNPPKFLNAFAYEIGVDDKTLENWTKHFPDFFLAYTRAKQIQREHIVSLANMGLYNSNFATFTMKNISSWRDKKDLELSGKVDAQLFFETMLSAGSEALNNERQIFSNN